MEDKESSREGEVMKLNEGTEEWKGRERARRTVGKRERINDEKN